MHTFAVGISRRQVPSNRQYITGGDPEVAIVTLREIEQMKLEPNAPCGPSLFLTPSEARHSGVTCLLFVEVKMLDIFSIFDLIVSIYRCHRCYMVPTKNECG